MLQDFLSTPLALGQSWSLAYELVFYGLVSAMFVMGVHRKSFAWSAGAFLLTMVVGTRHLPTEALNFFSTRTAVALALVARSIAVPFVWFKTRDAGLQRWLALALTTASIVLVLNRPETLSTSMFFFGTLFFGTSLFRWSAGALSGRRLALLAGLGVVAIVVMWTVGDVYWGLPFGVTTGNYRTAEIVTYLSAFVRLLRRAEVARDPLPALHPLPGRDQLLALPDAHDPDLRADRRARRQPGRAPASCGSARRS